ncbi:MAG: HTTM domain-containing protein [Planctomycetes bacterium]|nr:HTTM domain-containing protein [Planctomycetota bacterium]
MFRIAFGGLMLWEVLRFFASNWIRGTYIRPVFHFTYDGFEWVRPWPGAGMYVHFAVIGAASLCVALGFQYRAAAVVLFVTFAWLFLCEQAVYLNHFYLIALLAFLFVFLPAHREWSLDARRRPALHTGTVPAWALHILRFQIAVPYVFGGVAKISPDWLRGEPIRTWLRESSDFPVLGRFFGEEWCVYLFAYGGLLIDLFIVPLLLWRRTRTPAFLAAFGFHAMNALLFDIGVFPPMMIAASTIFFDPSWPRKFLRPPAIAERPPLPPPRAPRALLAGIALWVASQSLMPLRHFAWPGDVNWTEQGHRFSWHMKLRDKDGSGKIRVTFPGSGRTIVVNPRDWLNARQEREMWTHPDMLVEFAHFLREEYRAKGHGVVEVRAEVRVSLNGRPPALLVDPETDLASVHRWWGHSKWIRLQSPP